MSRNNNNNYRRNNNNQKKINFFRSGQIFGIIYHICLIFLLYVLVDKGQSEMAFKVFVINTGIVLFAFVISTIERVNFNSNKGNNRRRKK